MKRRRLRTEEKLLLVLLIVIVVRAKKYAEEQKCTKSNEETLRWRRNYVKSVFPHIHDAHSGDNCVVASEEEGDYCINSVDFGRL